MDDGRLAQIHVYPVKSARGTELSSAAVEPWGLAGDRRWAVVDEQGRRLKAIAFPAVMTITAAPRPDGGLVLTAPGASRLVVPPPSPRGDPVPVAISRLSVATAADPAAHAWLSALLGCRVTLVWLDDPTRRSVATDHGGAAGDVLSLADAGPLLLTSAASLRQLDEWIADTAGRAGEPPHAPLDMLRFRPNVIVDLDAPFVEDGWAGVRIGDVPFRVAERCDRCARTLFDPLTLERGKEPIRTLARHRRRGGRVYFGVRLVPRATGVIRVGDSVTPQAGSAGT